MAGNKVIKVGIGILVFKDGKVLLSKRKGSHGAGEYASPGGHLEFGELIVECARRECREETGIEIKNVRFLRLSNLKQYEGKHYIDIGLVADWKSGKPEVLEPEKAENWDWYDLNKLPKPLFGTIKAYLKALKTGKNFFDS
ncbi:MAG: NUDIX domain-containing protein [bacterium]|nr:NUDIX domain-containing protein [bacterium]